MSLAFPSSPSEPKIAELIATRALRAVFQPIVGFDNGAILGYEGLIRGPVGTPLEPPGALFAHAAREGLSIALEHAAAEICVATFAKLNRDSLLFLNFTAEAIVALGATREQMTIWLARHGMPAERIVLELTEQCAELIASVAALAKHRAKSEANGLFLVDVDAGAALLHMHEPVLGTTRAMTAVN